METDKRKRGEFISNWNIVCKKRERKENKRSGTFFENVCGEILEGC
jgi:hypothetical protein